jgi:sugar phosphate isomerase/epimerase
MPESAALPYTLSTVSLRSYPFARALEVAEGLGFHSVDLVGLRGLCEHVPVNGSRDDMRGAADVFLKSGLRAASVNADPGSFDGCDERDEVLRRVDLLLGFAADTEAPLLVLPSGEKSPHRVTDPQISQMADALNHVAIRAQHRGVRLAVEAPYFGRPVDTIARAIGLMNELDPDIELAFDVSHVEAADESVIDAWTRLSERVGIVHLRDAVSGNIRRVIGFGRIDFRSVFRVLDATAYTGDIVLELETRDSPFGRKEDEITAAVEYLDERR